MSIILYLLSRRIFPYNSNFISPPSLALSSQTAPRFVTYDALVNDDGVYYAPPF